MEIGTYLMGQDYLFLMLHIKRYGHVGGGAAASSLPPPIVESMLFWLPLVVLEHCCGFTRSDGRSSPWTCVLSLLRLTVFWSIGLNVGLIYKWEKPPVIVLRSSIVLKIFTWELWGQSQKCTQEWSVTDMPLLLFENLAECTSVTLTDSFVFLLWNAGQRQHSKDQGLWRQIYLLCNLGRLA